MNLPPVGDLWISEQLNCRTQDQLSGIPGLARARWILYAKNSHLQPSSCGLAIKRRTNPGLVTKGLRDLDPLPPTGNSLSFIAQNRGTVLVPLFACVKRLHRAVMVVVEHHALARRLAVVIEAAAQLRRRRFRQHQICAGLAGRRGVVHDAVCISDVSIYQRHMSNGPNCEYRKTVS